MTDKPRKQRSLARPREFAGEGQRKTLSFRVRGGLYERLKEGAEQNERSISEEIERRLEQSYDDDLLRGLGGRIEVAIRKVTARIIRVARQIPDTMRGTPLDHELNTRREWQAAVDVIKHAYAPTEVERPEDPVAKIVSRAWGSGDHGRLYTYNWLEFEGDDLDALDEAKSSRVDDWWTGDGGRVVGDLVEAGLLAREQASKRLFPEGEPTPLEGIMAEANDGRDRNAAALPRPSDSGPDEGDELPLNMPAEKPKRGRKTKTV